ncbi:hypothetical protein [Streptomyces sp. NPDC087270]|uniref:hypothetical protein n=1 Tax=Streptomyces sp. NPDC087270 TaxID=3365774 RepID=UPI0037F8BA3F
MATTEAVTQTTTWPSPRSGAPAGTGNGTGIGTGIGTGTGAKGGADAKTGTATGGYQPVPVWFFAFEGLIGASYDIVKSDPHGWIVIVVAVAVNVVLARTVLRGRLKMAKAILRGRKTRKLAVGLIALRVGVHFVLGLVGVEATSPAAHVAFALLMCATTVALLAFDQKIMLRALNADS